jgi:hypothetical protein
MKKFVSKGPVALFGNKVVSLRGVFFSDEAIFLTLMICLAGCQTPAQKPKESQAETVSALTSMTQGLTNQSVTEEQLKKLAVQVSKDPQAQSAIRSINTALSAQHTVKYCPEDGQRFSADMTYCPDGKVKLQWVD